MGFKSDIEIAQECEMLPITQIAEKAGIDDKYLEQYGKYKAKIDYNLLKESDKKDGKLILVTAINPTPAGEGKTTTTVGLADGMQRLGKSVMVALREPSLGPVFGVKGGAAGGGYAQVVPMEDINLHFTGDFHAIGAANNLLAAMIDNHIFQGNALNIDPRKITWRRCVDMNDRQLRNVVDGLGGRTNGIQVMNTQGAFYCILPIQIILMISDFIIALPLIHRDLPEHQMKSCLMQLFNHFLWVRPIGAFRIVKVTYCKRRSVRLFLIFGTIKNVKGCFIAPCFKNQHGSRELILFQKFNLFFRFLLRVPMVCRDPRPEDPVRRKNRRPGQRHILRN